MSVFQQQWSVASNEGSTNCTLRKTQISGVPTISERYSCRIIYVLILFYFIVFIIFLFCFFANSKSPSKWSATLIPSGGNIRQGHLYLKRVYIQRRLTKEAQATKGSVTYSARAVVGRGSPYIIADYHVDHATSRAFNFEIWGDHCPKTAADRRIPMTSNP